MKVTGYQLREAVRRWRDRRDVLDRNFKDSIWQFADDDKGNPIDRANGFKEADTAVARLEAAQQEFNQHTTLTAPDGLITLAIAVKRVGGAGRLAANWRHAATSTGMDKFEYRQNRRSKDDEFAKRMISQEDAMQQADKAAVYASTLRAAIAEANGTSFELEGLEPNLLS